MVGIQGIVPVAEPANPRRVTERAAQQAVAANPGARDEVDISLQAQDASAMARLMSQAEPKTEIHAEKVAKVRKALEQGSYRVQQVVLQVAARISKYLAPSVEQKQDETAQDGFRKQLQS